jgi:hypothetical protein
MPVEIPQVLQLIGLVPQIKAVSVFIEKLKVPKNLDGALPGALKDLMLGVLSSGNLNSIIQNPLSAIGSVMTGNLAGLAGDLASAFTGGEAATLISNINSLSSSVSTLVSDVGSFLGGGGIFDMISHAGSLDMFGDSIPTDLDMDTVLAPITYADPMSDMNDAATQLVADVISSAVSISAAEAQVLAWQDEIDALMPATTGAITNFRAAAPNLGVVSALAAFTNPRMYDPFPLGHPLRQFGDVVSLIVQASPLADMEAAAAEMQPNDGDLELTL